MDRRFGQPYIVGSFTRSDTVKSSRTFVYSSTQHSAAQTHRRQPIIGKWKAETETFFED